MKALKFSILALVAALLATACKKEYITEEYYNYYSEVNTKNYDIKANQWNFAEDGNRQYLYVTVDEPDITEKVLEKGAVLGYVSWQYNTDNGQQSSWNLMPYVYPFSYNTETESGEASVGYVGENFRMEYELGTITFVIEDLDGIKPEDMVDPISFKVVIIANKGAR